ncbi:hypothetical protein [Mobiluncus mulieris]|uniref:hypothetical protein n=1 Tax=Mobiluncus mulieris TaxID=2052 RepID=UPI0021E23F1A|nr:hypothetical protein [Mobiluncus mulieris]MCU9996281.1 hypothetical protein [Mobiluncus mulieris]MCV0012951.1 hypothetical protein [Mobiluncus mulieris]
MGVFPDVVQMMVERISQLPDAPLVVKVLPVDWREQLPVVHVTPGGGTQGFLERVTRINVDVYAAYPPDEGSESAEVLAERIHEFLVPGVGFASCIETTEGFADEVECDPIPTTIPYQIDDVALVSATYHVTTRQQ